MMEQNKTKANVEKSSPGIVRRGFLLITVLVGAIGALLVAVPFVGYLVRTKKRPVVWKSLGSVADFPLGVTRKIEFENPLGTPWDGMVENTAVHARYEGKNEQGEDEFLVLAINCAHLGCPVEWFPQSGLFMCPCHGGVYYANGEHASGPPPRGLFHCEWRVRDGQLEIQAPHYPTLQDTLTEKV